jgi:hypothetical protein
MADKKIAVGEAVFSVLFDTAEVDSFIERIERSLAAFKAEWNRKKLRRLEHLISAPKKSRKRKT